MIYPTAKTKAEFEKLWYIAQGHGNPTSYGYHDGLDINLKTGGDTDLGKPLYAVADFKRKYYHYASHLESGFGVHTLLEVQVKGQTFYLHYAHMMANPPNISEGKAGDIIGYIGKTGRPRNIMPAHLHFSVFKKLPPKLDMIATSKALLDEYWIDPYEFFSLLSTGTQMPGKMYKGLDLSNEDSMKVAVDVWADVRDGKYVSKDEHNRIVSELRSDIDKEKSITSETKKTFEVFKETLASKLVTIVDTAEIIGAVERLLSRETELQREVSKVEKAYALLEAEKAEEIKELKSELENLAVELVDSRERYEKQISNLKQRVEQLEQGNTPEPSQKALFEALTRFTDTITNLLRRDK